MTPAGGATPATTTPAPRPRPRGPSSSEPLRARQRGGSGDPTAGGLTLADWYATWAATRTVRPSTLAREESIWRCHIEPALGRRRLADLRRSTLSAWVAGLSADGLAPATVVRCSAVLRRILAAAVEDGILAASPAAGMARPRVDPPERRFLSPSELDQIEAAIDAQWALVIPFAATVGLRIGELSALRVQDLDLDAGTVRVRGTSVELSGHRSVATPKSRAGLRVVPTVTPTLAARLTKHIDARGLGRDDWLFATPEGTPLRPTNWRNRVWCPAVAAAGPRRPAAHPARPAPHSDRRVARRRRPGREGRRLGRALPRRAGADLRASARR